LLAARGIATAVAGGAGKAAISIMQPTLQQSAQSLLLVPSPEGEGCPLPAALWQMMPIGLSAVSAAARATPKLAMRLDRATA